MTLLIIFGLVAIFIAGFACGYHDRKNELKGHENSMYLWRKGWLYEGYGFVRAVDEKYPRVIYEAVERQKELDRVAELNLPKEAMNLPAEKSDSYQLGDWARENN